MIDEFGKYLWIHFPGVCVIASIVIIVIILCWKMFRLYGRLEKVEEKCEEIDTIKTDIQSIKTDTGKISTDLKQLIIFLSSQIEKFPNEFFISRSPIQLSKIGLELLEKFGGKKFIDNNTSYLVDSLGNNNTFKSALDVQNGAVSLLYTYSDKDGFVPIKNWVYNNPVYKTEDAEILFTLPIAINIMGIYLRDKYFETYPLLKDVDPEDN